MRSDTGPTSNWTLSFGPDMERDERLAAFPLTRVTPILVSAEAFDDAPRPDAGERHLAYVVPVHNEEALLSRNLDTLAARLRNLPRASLVVVENGSTDRSWALIEEFSRAQSIPTYAFRESEAGLGRAYDRALRELESILPPAAGSVIVLGAADLPFGFTDLDEALVRLASPTCPPLLLGSKAHAKSRLEVSAKRRAASVAYRLLRRTALGMRTGDCQGSIFIDADLAFALRLLIRSRDYFYTTELVFYVERGGHPVEELPVTLMPDERKSTVRLLRDGARMGMDVLRLARRGGRVLR